MTDRRVALLRGINVGRANRLAMADLRSLFGELGYADVRTLMNSGNVVFTVVGIHAGDETTRIERAWAAANRVGGDAGTARNLTTMTKSWPSSMSRVPHRGAEESDFR